MFRPLSWDVLLCFLSEVPFSSYPLGRAVAAVSAQWPAEHVKNALQNITTEGTKHIVLCGAATCSEGFVICSLKVPLACLGSMAGSVMANSLGNSQKKVNKTFGTSGRPTRQLRPTYNAIHFCSNPPLRCCWW